MNKKRQFLVASFFLAAALAVAFTGIFIYGLVVLGFRGMTPWVPLEGGLIAMAITLRAAIYNAQAVDLANGVC